MNVVINRKKPEKRISVFMVNKNVCKECGGVQFVNMAEKETRVKNVVEVLSVNMVDENLLCKECGGASICEQTTETCVKTV
jgi:hypothetical protein